MRASSLLVAVVAVASGACGGAAVPPPDAALQAYARAAERGDSAALYGMLTDRGKRSLGQEGVAQALTDAKDEITETAKAATSPGSRTEAVARVRWSDGEEATLTLEKGVFRVSSADALPAGARTPAQALEILRRVLARRSYAGVMRILSREARSAVEQSLRSLVEGLEKPEGLDVKVTGDRAVVQLQGGHVVRLRREGSTWTVEDFD